MLSAAFLSLLPLALNPRRERPPVHKCEDELRVKMRTKDGRDGYGCPCLTGPHRVLARRDEIDSTPR